VLKIPPFFWRFARFHNKSQCHLKMKLLVVAKYFITFVKIGGETASDIIYRCYGVYSIPCFQLTMMGLNPIGILMGFVLQNQLFQVIQCLLVI